MNRRGFFCIILWRQLPVVDAPVILGGSRPRLPLFRLRAVGSQNPTAGISLITKDKQNESIILNDTARTKYG
jgi:hypothetical protein